MNKISDVLLNRRTIRKYSPEPVGDDILNELLTMACRASTTGNMQVYSIIITRDDDRKRELCTAPFQSENGHGSEGCSYILCGFQQV